MPPLNLIGAKMEKKYFVIVEKQPDSCYGVYSPDFSTCFSAGDTFLEAVKNMKNAMDLCLENMDSIPAASDIETIEKYVIENYPADSVKTIVEIGAELPMPKAVRINISIPEDILFRLDKTLAGHKNRRSRFIADAVAEKLEAK